ncbi:MAG: YdcF family protein, partial [Lachnospiraceae bacterium]|nr:YdcF family protein [Lachnospiraceae bacterium]
MWQFTFPFFLIALFIFVGIMVRDARTLWSGFSFFWLMLWSAVTLFLFLSEYAASLMTNDVIIGILLFLIILAVGSIVAFPAVLILVFFVEGIRVI